MKNRSEYDIVSAHCAPCWLQSIDSTVRIMVEEVARNMELDLGDLGAPGTPGSAPGSPAGPAPLVGPTLPALPAGGLQMLGVPQAVDDGEERVARRNNNVRRVSPMPMALTAVPAVAAGKPAPQAQHKGVGCFFLD